MFLQRVRLIGPLPASTVLLALAVWLASAGSLNTTVVAATSWKANYFDAAANEPVLDEADVLAAINRWNLDIYSAQPRAALAYMWAMLLDPLSSELADTWRGLMEGATTVTERVARIDAWNAEHMSHTQNEEQFAELPGQDPWGVTLDGRPTFRKLIPSEMKAMERLTGRISGKCMTLANLLTSVFVLMDVQADDTAVLHLQMPGYRHAVAVLRWDGELIRTNNHRMAMFYGPGAPPSIPPESVPVYAIYNHQWFAPVEFEIAAGSLNPGSLDEDGPLMPRLVRRLGIANQTPDSEGSRPFVDLKDLRRKVFLNTEADATMALAKYAYQSLYVAHPEFYLKASLKGSLSRELATTLTDPPSVLAWMTENLDDGSIFPDGDERIMTADQVLVFKTASPKDRGMLAWTLLAHMGLEGHELILTPESAVLFGGRLYVDMSNFEFVDEPAEKLMVLAVDSP